MDKEKSESETRNDLRFEEIFKQNEKRIHYHIHRLGIRDPYREFYTEGMYAMWMAYKKYQPDKGPLATYFNYIIRNRLIDLIRKKTREREKLEAFIEKERQGSSERSAVGRASDVERSVIEDIAFWQEVQGKLTEKQWSWVYNYIILDLPVKEIARKKGVSEEAVKSWGKEVRRKLRG